MNNPYSSINWSTVNYITSTSHAHMDTQQNFEDAYATGMRCIAPSNYYPSTPWYPLEEFYENVPVDVVGLPNAEHHGFLNSPYPGNNMHLCTLGAMLTSGVNETGKYLDTWQSCVIATKDTLLFSDGGGVTINHPKWSYLTVSDMCRIIDFSPLVLGIEVYNDGAVRGDTTPPVRAETSYDQWDAILKTGRQIWGFWVPDHMAQQRTDWLGRCILLVPELTEYECAKAYREGRFYGAMKGTGLKFTEISLDGYILTVKTNSANSIEVITDQGIVKTVSTNMLTYSIPRSAIYARIKASDSTGEEIFSQPIQFITYEEIQRKRKFMLL